LNVDVYIRLTSNKRSINDLVIDSILVPPSIRAQSTHVQGTIGKSIQLRCSATVPFDTKIYWQRMDNYTITKFRQQQQHTHGDVIQTSLYIKDIEKNDFGFYGCFAESMSGKNHAIIELQGKIVCFSWVGKINIFYQFKESRRSTNAQILEQDELTTARIQILKRNKSKII